MVQATKLSTLLALCVTLLTVAHRPVAAQTPQPSGRTSASPVMMQPIAQSPGLRSYRTQIVLQMNGKTKGKPANGALNADLTQVLTSRKQSLTLSGTMLAPLLDGQMPIPVNRLTFYLFDKQTYVLAHTLIPLCASPRAEIGSLAALRKGLSAEHLLSGLSGDFVVRGTFVREEVVNGIPSRRYRLDVAQINALAKRRGANVQLSGGEVWLAQRGNFVTRLQAELVGNLRSSAGLDFEGTTVLLLNVSDLNRDADIPLPRACARPVPL
ncbi:MAG: hypothetical protein RMM31_06135 [Anaerolineae bacterium]|nr:hypothetical protein [Thermoflexales bacterium]MDW8395800.1 hypothetical protein [Anaerolineae bacterium]